MKNHAPIALFAYNRIDHLIKTVDALKANELASDSVLYIFSDGPKTPIDKESVEKVRDYLKTINGFKSVELNFSVTNKGLARSIIDGVTTLTENYGHVIVIEDDIVTSKYFLRYMNDALDIYRNEDRVFHISGYNFPIKQIGNQETYFIVPATCWGWATWKRAWKFFNRNTDEIIAKFNKKMIKDFNLDHANNYFQQLQLNQEGKLNTWAIFWHAAVYLNHGLSLHPATSLCQNIGHDGSGEHCNESNVFDVVISSEKVSIFQNEIKESVDYRKKVSNFFTRSKPPLRIRIRNKLAKFFR